MQLRMRAQPCIVLLLAALSTATGCRDSTAPDGRLVVALRAEPQGPGRTTEDASGPSIVCDVDLVAKTRGRGTATWQDATFYWYFGADRRTPVDSTSMSAEEIRDSWGKTGIGSTDSLRTTWEFSADAPFEVRVDMRYLTAGNATPATATTRFACGPVPTGATQLPTITVVTPPTGGNELQVGDRLTIGFTANAPQGLWTSGIVVRGPFEARQVFEEHGATSTSRSVTITVPHGSRLGVPLVIEAFATDAAFQKVVRAIPTQARVVDRTPPEFHFAFLDPFPASQLGGQFGVGDTLRIEVSALDNNALGWLIYSLGAPANVRDSVAAAPLQASQRWTVRIPIRPEWVGSPVLSLQLRDAAGLLSELRTTAPDGLRIYPTVARPLSAVVNVPQFGWNLTDMRYDARRRLLYIGGGPENRITVVDVATMTLAPSLQLPSQFAGFDLSPGGDSLIVVLPASRSLAVIDLARPSSAPTLIPLTVLDNAGAGLVPMPSAIRIASTGVAIVLLSSATGSGDYTISVDLRSGTQRIRSDARGTQTLPVGGLEWVPDRSRIAILGFCTRSYLAATDAFTACGPPAQSDALAMTFDDAGTRLSFGSHVVDAGFNLIRSMHDQRVVVTSDGQYLLGSGNGYVTKMRIADGIFEERWPVPFAVGQLFRTPDGNWLLAFDLARGRIVRVDLR